MAAPNIPGWQQLVLQGVGAPPTPQNIKYINAWAQAEGGGAANNPFNTTEPGYGTTGSYNSVGVKNYATPQQGIQATIATLKNGRYGGILGELRQGDNAMETAQALAASPWGTGALVEKVLGGPVSTTSQASVTPSNARAVTMSGLGNTTSPGADGARQALLQHLGGVLSNYGSTGQAVDPNPWNPMSNPATVPVAQTAAKVGANTGGGSGIVKTALTQIGIPYQWGGAAKLGGHTDCSGLLQASAAANGITVGRTTYQQWKQGTAVNPSNLQPGDAVFFHPGPNGPEHVGIYIGNGQYVEDPHTGDVVKTAKLSDASGFMGARRYT